MKRHFRMRILSSIVSAAVALSLTAIWSPGAFAAETYTADIRETIEGDYEGKVVILHSNDVHGAIEGYGIIAALRDKYEAMGAEVILADAGDYSQGDPKVNLSEGESAFELMKEVGYDLATLGNHEFDYGKGVLLDHLKLAKFHVLCANASNEGEAICDDNEVYRAKNGLKIGFFGLITPEAGTKANPKTTVGMEFLSNKEMYACAKEQVAELKSEGADVIIALTHLGIDEEAKIGGNSSEDVYANVKGIDLMIDGHSHTVMTEDTKGQPIQSTGTRFSHIGVAVLDNKGLEDPLTMRSIRQTTLRSSTLGIILSTLWKIRIYLNDRRYHDIIRVNSRRSSISCSAFCNHMGVLWQRRILLRTKVYRKTDRRNGRAANGNQPMML